MTRLGSESKAAGHRATGWAFLVASVAVFVAIVLVAASAAPTLATSQGDTRDTRLRSSILDRRDARGQAAARTDGHRQANAGPGGRRTFVWSRKGERIEISYEGDVEFTDDDTDVKQLSPGGYLKVSNGGWFGGRGVEIRADPSGALRRRYRVAIVEKPFEPEGRAWLARTLPRFIRESGLGAPARVARMLKSGGPPAVLAEIDRIEGGYGKRIYFAELFKDQPLDPATARGALAQASRAIDSDYELASLLIDSQHLADSEATTRAYFDAASTIESDYELRRVLSAPLQGRTVTPAIVENILARALSIESDYELASLLVEIVRRHPPDARIRGPFFAALDRVQSDYERGRVLASLATRGDPAPEILVSMLRSAARMGSDYGRAQFLLQVARHHAIQGAVRPAFFAALDDIGSSFEKGRVLQAVVSRRDTDADTVVAALRSAAFIAGGHERMQVLLAAVDSHQITGAARAAYMRAADQLGDYEQGRVLSALMRNERARRN